MSALRPIDSNGAYAQCHYDHALLSEIAEGTKANAEAIKTLTALYRETTRWLLVVVCIIALGNRAVDLAKEIWGSHTLQAQEK